MEFQTRPYSSSYSVSWNSPLYSFQDNWLCSWTCLLFKLSKSLLWLKLFCLSFIWNLPIFYFICRFYFGLLIFCCQNVAINTLWHNRQLNQSIFQQNKHAVELKVYIPNSTVYISSTGNDILTKPIETNPPASKAAIVFTSNIKKYVLIHSV